MKLRRLMTPVVHTCRSNDTLAEAARKMWDGDIGCLPVLDPEGRVISMITDRDIAMSSLFTGRSLHEQKVAQAMSGRLATVLEEDDAGVLEDAMRRAQVHRIPVVNATGHLRGIITLNDLAHHRHGKLVGEGVSPEEVAATLAVISEPRTAPEATPAQRAA
jgi:CBS domain-containing protein